MKRRGLNLRYKPLVWAVGLLVTWWCSGFASAQIGPPFALPPDGVVVGPTFQGPMVIPAPAPVAPATPAVAVRSKPKPKAVTVKVQKDGKTFYGKPLATDGKQLAVLRWDGRLTRYSVTDASIKVSKYSNGFKPYSIDEVKQRKKKYFGNRYTISTTEHFVVIHPKGGTKFWAEPFERHYKRLNDYFQTHGFKTSEPEFPLIAIVLRSRKEFDLRLDKEGTFDKNIIGYYSLDTNRTTTYAPAAPLLTPSGKKITDNWLEGSATVIHEVAHQIAYNCGVHSRFNKAPKWTSEGVAMLCETRGVYNFKKFPKMEDRVNRLRLESFRQLSYAGKTDGVLLQLLQSDRLFESNPELAYAVSWAISFYLNENRQAAYLNFLKRDARRGDFRKHTKLDRVGFFIRHFGKNIAGLEERMNLFIDSVN